MLLTARCLNYAAAAAVAGTMTSSGVSGVPRVCAKGWLWWHGSEISAGAFAQEQGLRRASLIASHSAKTSSRPTVGEHLMHSPIAALANSKAPLLAKAY
jgi:hypothetical protein